MSNINALQEMKRTGDYLICIDSDGCVFDTMEVKHKECFIPNIINYWNLQPVSKFARETAEYVNLYSKYRGINRFPALLKVIDLLEVRPKVRKRGFTAPNLDSLRKWAETEKRLGNPALERYVSENPDDELMAHTLRWSAAVNQSIADLVRGVPPFPYVRECLDEMRKHADIIVVSQTPCAALEREWQEHNIDGYVKVIAGQEMGTKAQCISYATAHGYEADKVLMIGDAPGDYEAATDNSVLFFPVNPGDEDNSWQRLLDVGLGKFFDGSFGGAYEKGLLAEFDKYLPSTPSWK